MCMYIYIYMKIYIDMYMYIYIYIYINPCVIHMKSMSLEMIFCCPVTAQCQQS